MRINIPVKWDSISKLLSQMVMIWFFTAMQTSLSLTVDQHLCCRVWFGCWWSNHFAKSIEMSTLCLCSGSLRPVGTGQALHKTWKIQDLHYTTWATREEESSNSSSSEVGAGRSSLGVLSSFAGRWSGIRALSELLEDLKHREGVSLECNIQTTLWLTVVIRSWHCILPLELKVQTNLI